jgi:hypothetical protein
MATKQRRLTAYHEAGHAVAALATGASLDYVTIKPNGDFQGHTKSTGGAPPGSVWFAVREIAGRRGEVLGGGKPPDWPGTVAAVRARREPPVMPLLAFATEELNALVAIWEEPPGAAIGKLEALTDAVLIANRTLFDDMVAELLRSDSIFFDWLNERRLTSKQFDASSRRFVGSGLVMAGDIAVPDMPIARMSAREWMVLVIEAREFEMAPRP